MFTLVINVHDSRPNIKIRADVVRDILESWLMDALQISLELKDVVHVQTLYAANVKALLRLQVDC